MAREDEAAWDSVLPAVMVPLDVRQSAGVVSLDRAALSDLHPAVRARVLRSLAGGLGATWDHGVTALAVDFARTGGSGRAIDLGGALQLGIELGRVVLGRVATAGTEQALCIDDAGPGQGAAVLDGSPIAVAWGGDDAEARRSCERFDLDVLRFPLLVRSRRPGDRIRLPGGTKKVKKLLLERRIPASERRGVPLVVDAEGHVLWIPGLARAEWSRHSSDAPGLAIGVG
jgi:tRNA(Ile)-lysidine synthase